MIWLWLQDASQDLRYAVRSLVRNPGFAGIVILTLAVGIGANTAIFSVVSAVLLRALPYSEPHRLVRVWSAYPERDSRFGTVSPLDLDDWRAESRTFQALAGYPSIRVNGYVLSDGDAPEELDTVFVTEDFFEVFGVGPVLGRTFVPDDHEDGNNQVAVLAHGTWRRRFGGDPEIVGRVLVLNNQPYTAVGIYGVVSYMVSQRSREIGVRMALGATREDVARLVLGQSLRWTVVGLALGMAAALVASRFVGSLLYGIGATDPVAFASAAVALLVIGAIASLIPARRASRTDPIAALRLD